MAEKAAQEEGVEEVKDDEPAKPKKLTKFQMQMQRAFY